MEAKLTDAKTGKILLEAIDRRGGTKDLSGMTNEWNDVEKAYIYWAARPQKTLTQPPVSRSR